MKNVSYHYSESPPLSSNTGPILIDIKRKTKGYRLKWKHPTNMQPIGHYNVSVKCTDGTWRQLNQTPISASQRNYFVKNLIQEADRYRFLVEAYPLNGIDNDRVTAMTNEVEIASTTSGKPSKEKAVSNIVFGALLSTAFIYLITVL